MLSSPFRLLFSFSCRSHLIGGKSLLGKLSFQQIEWGFYLTVAVTACWDLANGTEYIWFGK
jgi:hypothetical protein